MRYKKVIFDEYMYPTWNGSVGRCRLECQSLQDWRVAVIATEMGDNPGMSITNAVEKLATDVVRRHGIDPQKLIWIEHYGYPYRGIPARPRTYDRVQFDQIRANAQVIFQYPRWTTMGALDWERMGLTPPVDFISTS